eukprot:scaffold108638_cov39-Prasinocladus_malaysianus.AAC.1
MSQKPIIIRGDRVASRVEIGRLAVVGNKCRHPLHRPHGAVNESLVDRDNFVQPAQWVGPEMICWLRREFYGTANEKRRSQGFA